MSFLASLASQPTTVKVIATVLVLIFGPPIGFLIGKAIQNKPVRPLPGDRFTPIRATPVLIYAVWAVGLAWVWTDLL